LRENISRKEKTKKKLRQGNTKKNLAFLCVNLSELCVKTFLAKRIQRKITQRKNKEKLSVSLRKS